MALSRNSKKIGIALISICFLLKGKAQTHEFRFFPLKDPVLQQQGFMGKLGASFFLVDQTPGANLGLSIYDTLSRSVKTVLYDFPRQILTVIKYEQSFLLLALSRQNAAVFFQLLEINEGGEVISKNSGLLNGLSNRPRFLNSANKNFFLFYQLAKKSADSSFISGVLIGKDGIARKQLAYSFKQDKEQDAEPEIFLDNAGNTHVLVYDRYNNYRISCDLAVNTIPVNEEQMISETFNFRNTKLKSMHVFQNNECNCMQAEGMYVDGVSKNNKGLYSIAFPVGRKNELAPRFIPYTAEMIHEFKKGFSATDAMIQNSLQLYDWVYANSGSFALLKLSYGMPKRVSSMQPDEDISNRSLNRNLSISRAADFQPPSTTSATTPTRIRTLPGSADKYANAAPLINGFSPSNSSALLSRASGRNAPKLICIKLSREKGFEWHDSYPIDIFISGNELHNRIFLIGGENESISMVKYQADNKDEPFPVMITLKAFNRMVEKFPVKKLLFSPLQFLEHAQYGSLYANTENGEQGILLVTVK
ncbi:MAG: hypothetical protein RLZZ28_2209 [Bacteroidota bacterium]|jgi:hypothetical protein